MKPTDLTAGAGRWATRTAVVVCAVLASASGIFDAPARAGLGSPTVFTDPVGDVAGAPDIAQVAVTDDRAGTITFVVTVANEPLLVPGEGLELYLDTDRSLATGFKPPSGVGGGGIDKFITFQSFSDGQAFFDICTAAGSPYNCAGAGQQPYAASLTGSYLNGQLTISISKADLGTVDGFNFFVRSFGVSPVGGGGGGPQDVAPDSGPSLAYYLYSLGGAPTLGAPGSVTASSARTASVTVNGTAVAGSLVQIFDGSSLISTVSAGPTGGYSSALTLAVGAHTLTATQTVNGDTSIASPPVTVTVNPGTPPSPPTLSAPATVTASSSGTANLTANGTGVAGSVVQIFDGSSAISTVSAGPTGGYSSALTLAVGTHTLTATQTVNGFTSIASPAVTVTVGLAVPTLNPTPRVVNAASGAAAADISVTGTEVVGATVTIYDGSSLIATVANTDSPGSYATGVTLSIGLHSLTATQTLNGQTSSATVAVIVTVNPAGTLTLTAPTVVTAAAAATSASVTTSGTATPGAAVDISDGSAKVASTTADTTGSYTTTVTLPIGVHSLTATQTANGQSSAATSTVTVTVNPGVPTLSAPGRVNAASGATSAAVAVGGAGVAGATVQIFDGSALLATLTADASGVYSGTVTLALGSHVLNAKETVSGQTSGASGRNITVSSVGTVALAVSGSSSVTAPAGATSAAVALAATGAAGATLQIFDGSTLLATATIDQSGNTSITVALAIGIHSLSARQGSNSSPSSTVTVIPAAPTITAPALNTILSPTIVASTTVTFGGTGLPGATVAIKYGALASSLQIGSATVDASGNWSVTASLTTATNGWGLNTVDALQTLNGTTSPGAAEVLFATPAAPTLAVGGAESRVIYPAALTFTVTGTPAALHWSFGLLQDGETILMSAQTTLATLAFSPVTPTIGRHVYTAVEVLQPPVSAATAVSAPIVVDVAPRAPTLSAPASSDSTTVPVSGSALPGASVRVYEGPTLVGAASADASGNWSANVDLGYGLHGLTATQTVNGEASDHSLTATVIVRSPQSISFAPLPDRIFGDPPFAVSATGGASANPVSFSAAGQCTVSGSTVTITGVGTCTVTARQDGNANYLPAPEVAQTFAIVYDFRRGFSPPVDNPPTVNVVKAGSAIPVSFGLGGDQGLAILAAGSPSSREVSCDTASPFDDLEPTASAGNSTLAYDATSGLYTYVWKSDKSWAGTCRQLDLGLIDGTDHVALFKFR
jgi:hypothetical protein